MSQKGSKSETNEDACLSMPSRGFFVVADGVGGGPCGDFASRAVVDTLYSRLAEGAVSESSILDSIHKANELIYESAQTDDRQGMATTVVACWLAANQLCCFNAGDSRIYRIRAGSIMQLTRDHTRQIQKASNIVKQVVTNAVGIKPTIKVEVTSHDSTPGDMVLLTTDGITDLLDDAAILSIVDSDKMSLADKARALVVESERRGGRDDKSVILAIIN